MPDCERIETCIFFNDKMPIIPDMTPSMKERYCRGDNSYCARYMVFLALGKEGVPKDLYPNERNRVNEILKP